MQIGYSWLMLHIGTHPLKHTHARHNAGNRRILVQLLFFKDKKGQILSEELLLFWKLFYNDEDQKQKNSQNSSSSGFTNSFFKAFLTFLPFIYFAFREPVPWNPLGKELSHHPEWWIYLNTRSVPNRYRKKLLKTQKTYSFTVGIRPASILLLSKSTSVSLMR